MPLKKRSKHPISFIICFHSNQSNSCIPKFFKNNKKQNNVQKWTEFCGSSRGPSSNSKWSFFVFIRVSSHFLRGFFHSNHSMGTFQLPLFPFSPQFNIPKNRPKKNSNEIQTFKANEERFSIFKQNLRK